MMTSRVITLTLLLAGMVTASTPTKEVLGISNLFTDQEKRTLSLSLAGANLSYPLNKYGLPSQKFLNMLVDSVLGVGLDFLDSDLPISDAKENFTAWLGLKKLKGTLMAKEGQLSDLKTVRRVGNTVMMRKGDRVKLTVILGFSELEAFFAKYTMDINSIHTDGDLKVKVEHNKFQLEIELKKNKHECKVRLYSFNLLAFDGIDVEMTGVDSEIPDSWIKWIEKHIQEEIATKTERIVSSIIGDIVADKQEAICYLLKGYHF